MSHPILSPKERFVRDPGYCGRNLGVARAMMATMATHTYLYLNTDIAQRTNASSVPSHSTLYHLDDTKDTRIVQKLVSIGCAHNNFGFICFNFVKLHCIHLNVSYIDPAT